MALTSGTRLGPYEIQSPLGAGGMGEVYRAKDTRLDRTVAVKVLASHLSSSPELKQRMEREARTISSLNHPNICHLYDIGSQDGADYLVMEFLEGETLAERLRKGALPLTEIYKIAIAVAEALAVAHRSGIVHRDLKPGNVMLTQGGAKLMDFGLAKPLGAQAGAPGSGTAPPSFTAAATLSGPSPLTPLTTAGSIVGTIQYMSPEQIEGKEADARSDIFAFGAGLYEMVAGKRPFSGKSQISLASSILESDPAPISAVKPQTPSAFEHVVTTCLQKNPEERYQTAHDIKLELQWIADAPPTTTQEPVVVPARHRWLPWTAAAVLAIIAIAFAVAYLQTQRTPQVSVHAYVLPPEKAVFLLSGNDAGPPVLSPDGLRIAFVAKNADSKQMLWIRPLNSAVAQPMAGTEGATFPFWSADSRYVAFFAAGKLNKLDASGGPPQAICDALSGRGGTWNSADTIIFAPDITSGLSRVDAAGGTRVALTTLAPDAKESSHRWPDFLPDGNHFLYFAHGSTRVDSGIYLAALDSKERKLLLRNDSNAIYAAPGYLLFIRDNTLMAQRFNPRSLVLEGEAKPVADHVAVNTDTWRSILTASANGELLYQHGAAGGGSQLVWYDASGKPGEPVLPEPAGYSQPSLIAAGAAMWYWRGKSATPQIDSIAVIPFTNVGGNADADLLSDGLTESLISSLAHVPQLKVKSRNSVFRYKGKDIDVQKIGKELTVDALLTGRVVQHGDTIQVSADLTNVQDNTEIWGEQYQRKASDIIALQQQIAGDIAVKLRSTMTGAEKQQVGKQGTQNAEAYQLYVKGRYYWNKRTVADINTAISLFNQAIDKDPAYAQAYAGVADCYLTLHTHGGDPKELFGKATAAANKALELDPTLARPHADLGLIKMQYDWDFSGGEVEFRKAIELDPGDATAHQWFGQWIGSLGGRARESIDETTRARELDPLSPIIAYAQAAAYSIDRQYDKSIEMFKKISADNPAFGPAHGGLAFIYWTQKKYPPAVQEWSTAAQLEGGKNTAEADAAMDSGFRAGGWPAAARKWIEVAIAQYKAGVNFRAPYDVAEIYVDLGDKDHAFQWLNTAYQVHSPGLIRLRTDPILDPLRADPRYAELVRKIGFPQ